MKRFRLFRKDDVSGVSGIGFVAEGILFSNGKAVMCWTTKYSTIVVFDSIADVISIHGHNGSTEIRWID